MTPSRTLLLSFLLFLFVSTAEAQQVPYYCYWCINVPDTDSYNDTYTDEVTTAEIGTTMLFVDAYDQIIGPAERVIGGGGRTYVKTPSGEWGVLYVRSDGFGSSSQTLYTDDLCGLAGGAPYIQTWPKSTDMLAATGAGVTGMLYGPLSAPVETQTFYSRQYADEGCVGIPEGMVRDARLAEPFPLAFTPPFTFQVR